MADRCVQRTASYSPGDASGQQESEGFLVVSYPVEEDSVFLLEEKLQRPFLSETVFGWCLQTRHGSCSLDIVDIVVSLCCLLFVCLVFFVMMGQMVMTPLCLTLDQWSEVKDRAHNMSVEVKNGKWQTFGVGWPLKGSFDLTMILFFFLMF